MVVILDGARLTTKADLLACIASEFHFPEYWGQNWDALSDCLQDLSWLRQFSACLLVVENFEMLLGGTRSEVSVFLDILEDVGSSWADGNPEVPFNAVLIDGAG